MIMVSVRVYERVCGACACVYIYIVCSVYLRVCGVFACVRNVFVFSCVFGLRYFVRSIDRSDRSSIALFLLLLHVKMYLCVM
jgi:hypothetical protein